MKHSSGSLERFQSKLVRPHTRACRHRRLRRRRMLEPGLVYRALQSLGVELSSQLSFLDNVSALSFCTADEGSMMQPAFLTGASSNSPRYRASNIRNSHEDAN